MKKFSKIFLAVVATASLGCTKENQLIPDEGPVSDVNYITIHLEDSKTSYAMDGNNLKTSWSKGDVVCVSPGNGLYQHAGTYVVTNPGESTGVFREETAVNVPGGVNYFGIFYPGDKINGVIQYSNFSYDNQVQKKSDPMGHLGDFHTMYIQTEDYSNISLAGATQSACMKFTLSGMTFHKPVKIELRSIGSERFYANNSFYNGYYYYKNDTQEVKDLQATSILSLNLEGYGDEDSIEAWMMMSNEAVQLKAADIITVSVYQEDGKKYSASILIPQKTTLSGGKWHNLKINGGWTEGESEDEGQYEGDGDVIVLQEGIEGLDLILMGDGFISEDINDGTYESIMRQAYEEFFSVEPFRSIKNDFNVYYVKVISPERTNAINTGYNGATNTGSITRLSCRFTENSTYLTGNTALAREYAMKALSANGAQRIKDATIVVMVNQACRAGTCHTSWYNNNGKDYGQANSVAFCALGTNDKERRDLMKHEICGHGFGKLADEYYSSSSSINTSLIPALDNMHNMGLYRNADKYIDQSVINQGFDTYPITTTENVYWHDLFGTANNYESSSVEALGVFKGGYTYSFLFCRPTEDPIKSIMNSDGLFFNAISRRQIYYRYLRLAGIVNDNSYGTEEELNRFLAFDAQHCLPSIIASQKSRMSTEDTPVLVRDYEEMMRAHSPMVLISGTWDEEGRFTPDASQN